MIGQIYPIKVEKVNRTKIKLVEWRLSNVCNYKCSYCPSIFNNGSKGFLNLEQYINVIDNLYKTNDDSILWFQFTGGEPTLYPKLLDLLQYIKTKNGYTSLISNGSRTIRWWKELANLNVLNRLYLTLHSEFQVDPMHLIEVNDLMQDMDCLVTVFVTAPADTVKFKLAVKNHNTILAYANAISHLKPLTELESFQNYSEDQWKIINQSLYTMSPKFIINQDKKKKYIESVPWFTGQVKVTFSDNSSQTNFAQHFIDNKLNKFYNWLCDIGKSSLVIECDEVYRGICRQGGCLGNINENISWASDSIICKKEYCNCAADFYEDKQL